LTFCQKNYIITDLVRFRIRPHIR